MLELPPPIEKFRISSRVGDVFIYDKNTTFYNVRGLTGQHVRIDGVEYRVNGVEHWAIECTETCNHGPGLLVEPV